MSRRRSLAGAVTALGKAGAKGQRSEEGEKG